MKPQSTALASASSGLWERLEDFVREQIQRLIQAVLEEEVTELLGRANSTRRDPIDAPAGYRNGYGKLQKLAMTIGTITVRRPRVRGLAERFVSRVLPLFHRRTTQVGALSPQLYLHGLALNDFELALRGLRGDAAPLSPTSLARLKAQWQLEYEAWTRRLSASISFRGSSGPTCAPPTWWSPPSPPCDSGPLPVSGRSESSPRRR